jgi:hypothetical protein
MAPVNSGALAAIEFRLVALLSQSIDRWSLCYFTDSRANSEMAI